LGIGPNPQSPIPNPQSPIPKSIIYLKIIKNIIIIIINIKINIFKKKYLIKK